MFGGGAGGDDECVARVAAGIAFETEWALREVGRVDVVEHDFGTEAAGVFLETFHEFRPLNALGLGWPVVHLGSGHELAALREPGDENGLEVGACGVDGGGVAGGAGTEDEKAAVTGTHAKAPKK